MRSKYVQLPNATSSRTHTDATYSAAASSASSWPRPGSHAAWRPLDGHSLLPECS
jgi:hypothetical protein